jgi:hypothetical protein
MTGKIRGWLRWILAGIILALFVVAAVWVIEGAIRVAIFDSYVETIARKTGLNRYLVNALWGALLIPFYLGIHYALQVWNRQKRWTGITILVVLYVVYNVGLYMATKSQYRGKWFVRTPDGIKLYDRRTEDGKDPVYGYELKRVTPEVVPEIIALQEGCNPINPREATFFNPTTGDPQVWYYEKPGGGYDFFDGPCHHPKLGTRLKPVTRTVVRNWKQQAQMPDGQGKSSPSGEQDSQSEEESTESSHSSSETGEPKREGTNANRDANGDAARADGDADRTVNRERAQEDSESRPAEQAQRERREYRQRYLDMSALERFRGASPITLVAMEGETSFEQQFVRRMRRRGIDARTGILKPAAFRSETVSQGLTSGDDEMLRQLGLAQLSGRLVWCRLSFDEPVDTGELLKTRARLSVSVVPFNGGRVARRDLNARGADFDAVGGARASSQACDG